jgi:hypothetical protein
VIRRFQIEDLISQDGSGVVFRALDTESGNPVAVRRFFPFGATGGGLQNDEQVAYDIAISRLAGLSHPALRSVICGGCDPVDGMPFIATEWVEGESLLPILDGGQIPAESATVLITKALEVCELLSHVLAEEAVWVETDIRTIIVGNEESGRGFTFWISPFKWLGGNGENRGLESLVTLTEEVMGWTGRTVNDQEGRGLGGWVNWLRNAATTTTLHEAREMLAASIGVEPPQSAGDLVAHATSQALKPLKRPGTPKMPVFAILLLFITVAALGSWMWIHKNSRIELPALSRATPAPHKTPALPVRESPAPAPKSSPTPPEPVVVSPEPKSPPMPDARPAPIPNDVEDINKRIAALSAKSSGSDRNAAVHASQPTLEDLAAQKAVVEKQGGVFSPEHSALLLEQARKEVTVKGVFEEIEFSPTRKTIYLVFAGDKGSNSARGSVVVSKAPAGLSETALRELIGKTICLHGKVEVQKSAGSARPLIVLKDRASIKEVD